jgi:hypothetical protein
MFFSKIERDDEHQERNMTRRPMGGGDGPFDRRIGMGEQGSEYDGPFRWLRPDTSSGSSDFKNDELATEKPSTGRRMSRAVLRFSFVFLIGVGTTLGWQSYHGEAKELVGTWVPSLSWVLARAPATADTPSELAQHLKPVAIDLAFVRRSLEQLVADQKQLAAKQEEIAYDVAMIQSVERDLRQNISSGPPPGAVQIPRPKPGQPLAQSLAAH